MKIKYKVLVIMFLMTFALFGSGITYSIFNSKTNLITTDQKIAKFVFNANKVDYIELELTDINPGDIEEYLFSVSNTSSSNVSDITVDYQITVKTYHFIPLNIELYKIEGDIENKIMTCDEKYTRNENNELVCHSEIQNMSYDTEIVDNYKIRITFPMEYNDVSYANLVDFIDLEISSWQKTGE